MMYKAVSKRKPAIELFPDMRESERPQEESYLDSSSPDDEDSDIDYWRSLYSSEALVDEMDRLNDLSVDLDYNFFTP